MSMKMNDPMLLMTDDKKKNNDDNSNKNVNPVITGVDPLDTTAIIVSTCSSSRSSSRSIHNSSKKCNAENIINDTTGATTTTKNNDSTKSPRVMFARQKYLHYGRTEEEKNNPVYNLLSSDSSSSSSSDETDDEIDYQARLLDQRISEQQQKEQPTRTIVESENNAELFASFRILSPKRKIFRRNASIAFQHATDFYDDIYNFTSGSLPHSIIVGTMIGTVSGIITYLYYIILEYLLQFIWKTIPQSILIPYIHIQYHWIYILVIGYCMAIGVGCTVQYIGDPGDIYSGVEWIHTNAYIGIDHIIPMICASYFGIIGGGSLDPSTPLVVICASIAGYISRTIFQTNDINIIRKHSLMGCSSALSAFFGVPLGGSLAALEINNRFGLEYYEHTVEAIFSGTICVCVYCVLKGTTIGCIWDISNNQLMELCHVEQLLIGGFIGLLGAGIAAIFSNFHQKYIMGYLFDYQFNLLRNNQYAIRRAVVGSTFVLLIGIVIPQTMFWGEDEFPIIANMSNATQLPYIYPTSGIIHFEMNSFTTAMIVGIAKMISISFTFAAGYRGGCIFPFFLAGASFGRAFLFVVSSSSVLLVPPQLATLCFAAAINVALTRTSIATTLILTSLSGESNANPPILVASIVSLFVTSYMPFIRSQKKRADICRDSMRLLSSSRYITKNYGSMKKSSSDL